MTTFDNINIDPNPARASVEYARARVAINESGASRVNRRDAKMAVVEVLHGHLEHKNGHTIVVFKDNSEARF